MEAGLKIVGVLFVYYWRIIDSALLHYVCSSI